MSWREAVRRRGVLQIGLLAGWLVMLLVILTGANPYAATASPLQYHGALLNEDGGVGIISHRGAAAIAPENTLAAMRTAIEQGVDFIEMDVQLTRDLHPVLLHDETLDRTTTGAGPLAEKTLEEVRQLDAGLWFSPEFAGEPVPTLEELVDLLAPVTTRAFIELKGVWPREQVEETVALFREEHLVNRVVLQSFEVENLELVQEAGPEFAKLLLTRELTDDVLETVIELQVSAVGAREKLFRENPRFARSIRGLGIGAVVYTLNDEKKWRWAARSGIDFVITDDPVTLAAWREERLAS